MTTPPTLRQQALEAAHDTIRDGRWWLPPAGQAEVVDAVLEVAGRRAVAFQTRIDAARAWARQHLEPEQQAGLLAVLRGDDDPALG